MRHVAPILDEASRALHCLKTRAKGLKSPLLIGVGKVGRQFAADGELDRFDHLRKPLTHELSIGVIHARRHAELSDNSREHRVGEHLAVGENAVEVKDDGAVARTQLRTQLPGVQGW